jgi:hypothetical protein
MLSETTFLPQAQRKSETREAVSWRIAVVHGERKGGKKGEKKEREADPEHLFWARNITSRKGNKF